MMRFYKSSKKVIAFLLVVLLVLGTAPAALANEVVSPEPSTGIIYKGKSVTDRWFYRDVDTTYTTTDLFKNFKGVMPGDELTQKFIVKNEAKNRIKLYMEVLPHGENVLPDAENKDNPLSKKVAAKTTTAQSIEFLNQFAMQVVSVSGEQEKVLFDIPANPENNPDIKGLGTYYNKAELGTIAAGYGTELEVRLQLPLETVGNEFANRIGEVDFRFTIEEYEPGGGGGKLPEEEIDDSEVPKDEPVIIPGESVEEIPDPEVPLGDAPKTGDNTKILPLMLLMFAALAGLVMTRRKFN